METAFFVERYPRLFHMAEANSWKSIFERGLLSTSALLDLFQVTGSERAAIEEEHRPASITIKHEDYGIAVVRDQKPMSDRALERCLIGLTPREWYMLLNRKVFFWTSLQRLEKLLSARAYRGTVHDVLTIDTHALVRAQIDQITLCPYNSGNTLFNAVGRGQSTFRTIHEYPIEEWRRKRGGYADAVVEVAVDYAIPNVSEMTLCVERRREAHIVSVLYVGPEAAPDEVGT